MINDVHCHFFSERFFAALAEQRGQGASGDDLTRELGWDAPGSAETLADRWVRELDANAVSRAALIASVPQDEEQVARAVARHPSRFVGFFMVNPGAADAIERVQRALAEQNLRVPCLFPAMHHVPLHDARIQRIVEAAADRKATAVFVHCGVLSVGVRRKLRLASRFDMRLGNPLELQPLALAFPNLTFIVPHLGAGMLREALMVADVCPNVYLDTSSSNGWVRYTPGLTLEAALRAALGVVGPSRLLFGTDSSFFPRGWQRAIYEQQKQLLDAMKTTAEEQALIFGGNFDRLFATGR